MGYKSLEAIMVGIQELIQPPGQDEDAQVYVLAYPNLNAAVTMVRGSVNDSRNRLPDACNEFLLRALRDVHKQGGSYRSRRVLAGALGVLADELVSLIRQEEGEPQLRSAQEHATARIEIAQAALGTAEAEEEPAQTDAQETAPDDAPKQEAPAQTLAEKITDVVGGGEWLTPAEIGALVGVSTDEARAVLESTGILESSPGKDVGRAQAKVCYRLPTAGEPQKDEPKTE